MDVGIVPEAMRTNTSHSATRRRSNFDRRHSYDHKEVTMKTQVRIASLSLLTILCLMLAGTPAMAGNILYENGPLERHHRGLEHYQRLCR